MEAAGLGQSPLPYQPRRTDSGSASISCARRFVAAPGPQTVTWRGVDERGAPAPSGGTMHVAFEVYDGATFSALRAGVEPCGSLPTAMRLERAAATRPGKMAGAVGIEPTTYGVRVRRSAN